MIALALLFVFAAPGGDPAAAAARFADANRAYLERDLEAAIRGYEALRAEGWESPALHVNLGNARLLLGRRGAAVASYLRALRIDPGDADARANLAAARAAGGDELDPPARPLLHRALDRAPDAAALALFALGWAALWGALAARTFAGGARRALGVSALAAAAVAAAGGALLAGKAAAHRARLAVVVVPAAAVREGPEPALRPILDLHEGAEVRVLEPRGAAVRVRLGSGAEGWIAASELEGVSP